MEPDVARFSAKADLFNLPVVDQILHLAWFCHTALGQTRVVTGDIRKLYDQLHLNPPNISSYLSYLSDGKGRRIIRDKSGFRVEGKCRAKLDEKFLEHATSVDLSPIASSLREKLTNSDEIDFLTEAFDCYRVKAFRSFMIMVWCLAISHVMEYIISDAERLGKFNSSIKMRYPKKDLTVTVWEDFSDLKEFEVIDVAQHAKLLSKNRADVLREKLKRRNMAAHPSSIEVTQAQADDYVTDLVNNIVTKLN